MPARPSAAPSQVLAGRLRSLRERVPLTQRQLAAELAKLGYKIGHVTIARTETGERTATVDELFAFAAVFGVSPSALLIPTASADRLEVVPKVTVPARHARAWLRGRQPLRPDDARAYYQEVGDEEWAAMQDTSLQYLLDRMDELVQATIDRKRAAMADAVDAIEDEVERMRAAETRRAKTKGGST